MLSIVVAIHNQIGHNQLFLDGIRRYTTGAYELIVVDNHSTDGSGAFFESKGCRVIKNLVNLCYPESMNLGIQASTGDRLCFINNDLYVGPDWNGLLVDAMEKGGLDAVSPLGIEQMPSRALTDWMHGRWDRVGRSRHVGKGKEALRRMIDRMYGDWEAFCMEVHRAFHSRLFEGIIGSCVMMRRSLLEKIGPWDERVQAADWDIYYRVRKREQEVGDVHRIMIVGSVYVHHFIRATLKGRPEPFGCTHPRLSIDQKWTQQEQAKLWYKPWDFSPPPEKTPIGRAAHSFGKPYKRLVKWIAGRVAALGPSPKPDLILEKYRERFRTMGQESSCAEISKAIPPPPGNLEK